MTSSILFSQAYDLIRQAERILILTDQRPDGDSIGASSAMLNWLLREGKNVRAFCPERMPQALQFIDGVHHYGHDPKLFDEPFDLVMTFDAPNRADCRADAVLLRGITGDAKSGVPDRAQTSVEHGGGAVAAGPVMPIPIIVFDHHVTHEPYGTLNIVLTDASSTAEVVHRFFQTNGIAVDASMATSLLAGILYDTTHFSNAATTAASLEAAGSLMASGARLPEILKHQIRNKSVHGLKLWGLALSRLTAEPKWNLTYTYFLREDFAAMPGGEELADGLSNFLQMVCGDADTILVLRETADGKVRGSFRSLTSDVSERAKLFGGGGHKKAAGFTVEGRIRVENGKLSIHPLDHLEKLSYHSPSLHS